MCMECILVLITVVWTFQAICLFLYGIFHGEDEDTGDKDHTVSAFLGKVTSSPLGLKFQDDDIFILESSLPVG